MDAMPLKHSPTATQAPPAKKRGQALGHTRHDLIAESRMPPPPDRTPHAKGNEAPHRPLCHPSRHTEFLKAKTSAKNSENKQEDTRDNENAKPSASPLGSNDANIPIAKEDTRRQILSRQIMMFADKKN